MNMHDNDNVFHPAHYTSGKIEVIDFIEDQKLNFHLGNALKYICRAGKKNKNKMIEDLMKAVWYLNRQIDNLEKANNGADTDGDLIKTVPAPSTAPIHFEKPWDDSQEPYWVCPPSVTCESESGNE